MDTKKLDRHVLKNILLQAVLGAAGNIILFKASLFAFFILNSLTIIYSILKEINKKYALTLSSDEDGEWVGIIYYTFLDKVKAEKISREDIRKIRKFKSDKQLQIELKNYRIIHLYFHEKFSKPVKLFENKS